MSELYSACKLQSTTEPSLVTLAEFANLRVGSAMKQRKLQAQSLAKGLNANLPNAAPSVISKSGNQTSAKAPAPKGKGSQAGAAGEDSPPPPPPPLLLAIPPGRSRLEGVTSILGLLRGRVLSLVVNPRTL